MTRHLTLAAAKKRWMKSCQYSDGIVALCQDQEEIVQPSQKEVEISHFLKITNEKITVSATKQRISI